MSTLFVTFRQKTAVILLWEHFNFQGKVYVCTLFVTFQTKINSCNLWEGLNYQ